MPRTAVTDPAAVPCPGCHHLYCSVVPRQRTAAERDDGPPWWVRDVIIALVVGIVIMAGQWRIDDARSDREGRIAREQDELAERRENLRFVRDRSTQDDVSRPYGGMDLRGQNLSGLNLSGANLEGAKLDGASLIGTNLADATVWSASFRGADLSGANLDNVYFDCSGMADLPCGGRADFTDAIFPVAAVSGYLGNTILVGADLEMAMISEDTLKDADPCYDATTRWPEGIYIPPSNCEGVGD